MPDHQTTELPIVRVDPQDTEALTAWATAATTVFLQPHPTAEQVAERSRRMAGHRLYAARDGARTVATFRSFDSDLTLPGATDPLPVNAISSVTVLPTHRRRRLLSRWMVPELADARDRGFAASILIASEAGIYGRFGFGVATRACRWTLDANRARFRPERVGSVEIVEPQTFVDTAPAVYGAARAQHTGTIERTLHRWETLAQTVPGPGEPDRQRRLALHRGPGGEVDGVLVYAVHDAYEERVASARLVVQDLWAVNQQAYADLWRFCCEVDFVTTVVADDRSPDEHLPLLLTDPRTARDGAVSDFLWARIHDVPAALAARRYPVPGRLVLQVDDPLDQCGGRYLLESGDDGSATCEPETGSGAADLVLDVAALAALWLGDARPGVLARAGRLTARDETALARASALFGWPLPAFCGTWF